MALPPPPPYTSSSSDNDDDDDDLDDDGVDINISAGVSDISASQTRHIINVDIYTEHQPSLRPGKPGPPDSDAPADVSTVRASVVKVIGRGSFSAIVLASLGHPGGSLPSTSQDKTINMIYFLF